MDQLKDIKAIAILIILCILGYILWHARGVEAENERLSGQVAAFSTRLTKTEGKFANYDALLTEKLDYDSATRNATARDRGRTTEVAKHDPDSAHWLDAPVPQCLRDGACIAAGAAGKPQRAAASH